MSIVTLFNCIVCREPISPGSEHKMNHARHASCAGAGPLTPDPPPPEISQLLPGVTDVWTVQAFKGLMQERDHYQGEAARYKQIAESIIFQHSQLDAANHELKTLALFYREFFPAETADPSYCSLSASGMAIVLMRELLILRKKQNQGFLRRIFS